MAGLSLPQVQATTDPLKGVYSALQNISDKALKQEMFAAEQAAREKQLALQEEAHNAQMNRYKREDQEREITSNLLQRLANPEVKAGGITEAFIAEGQKKYLYTPIKDTAGNIVGYKDDSTGKAIDAAEVAKRDSQLLADIDRLSSSPAIKETIDDIVKRTLPEGAPITKELYGIIDAYKERDRSRAQDKIDSDFAIKIANAGSIKELQKIMEEGRKAGASGLKLAEFGAARNKFLQTMELGKQKLGQDWAIANLRAKQAKQENDSGSKGSTSDIKNATEIANRETEIEIRKAKIAQIEEAMKTLKPGSKVYSELENSLNQHKAAVDINTKVLTNLKQFVKVDTPFAVSKEAKAILYSPKADISNKTKTTIANIFSSPIVPKETKQALDDFIAHRKPDATLLGDFFTPGVDNVEDEDVENIVGKDLFKKFAPKN